MPLHQRPATAPKDDDDQTIAWSTAPAAATAALLKIARRDTIDELVRDKQDGAVVYAARWKVDGVDHEASVTGEGLTLATEETVRAQMVPVAVKKAVSRYFPAGSTRRYEKKLVVVYEAEAVIQGEHREVVVLPTGKVIVLDLMMPGLDGLTLPVTLPNSGFGSLAARPWAPRRARGGRRAEK